MASSVDHSTRGDDENYELLSLHLSHVLDILGYSHQMVKYRIQAYQERDRQLNTVLNNKIVTAGSKGEGLTRPTESDTDLLYIPKYVVCVEEDYVHNFQDQQNSLLSFNPNYKRPGYSLLNLRQLAQPCPAALLSSIVPSDDGRQFVSSDIFVRSYETEQRAKEGGGVVRGRMGPAVNVVCGKTELDQVVSLISFNPTALNQWLQRPRRYDWPPLDVKCKISMMEGNFVGKGCKQSKDGKHEWRQCFNEIELVLMHSFNETKTQVYVLLKVILKGILRPLDKTSAITSYMMKNIVFWLSEDNPTEAFQPRYLMRWVIKGLLMLRVSLMEMFIPYYMIPTRNLLADSMPEEDRHNLVVCLSCLIREGPRLLFRCKKLSFTREMTHAEIRNFGERRSELEMLSLSTDNCEASTISHGHCDEKNSQNEAMYRRMYELVHSDWPRHLQDDISQCANQVERLEVILS